MNGCRDRHPLALVLGCIALGMIVATCRLGWSQQEPSAGDEPPPAEQAVESPSPLVDRQAQLREVLALADWDESRLAKFADGQPLTADEQLEIWRLVDRMTTLDPQWFHRRYGRDVTPRQLMDDPGAYRGQLLRLRGQARKVEPQQPSADDQRRLSIANFYQTTIDVDGTAVVVTTPQVPRRWQDLEPLDQPVEVAGLMVKLVDDPLGAETPHLVAAGLAWYPAEVKPPTVNYGMSILGILDIDVSQLDRLLQRRPLTPEDAPAFYQVLEGLGRSSVQQLQGAADRQLRQLIPQWELRLAEAVEANDRPRQLLARSVITEAQEGHYAVAPFFNTPREQMGQIASFHGVVRSALRVEVEPRTAALHGGLDHYYQLALFTTDSQNYPIFFCVRELPGGFPLGEGVDVPVRVAGFFLKMWKYRSRADAEDPPAGGRAEDALMELQAPLFVGLRPEVIPPPVKSESWGYLVVGGLLTLLAGFCVIEWFRSRSDRRFAATTLTRMQRSADELDFDRLASEVPGATPDEEDPDVEVPSSRRAGGENAEHND